MKYGPSDCIIEPGTESYGDVFAEILVSGVSSQSSERISDDASGVDGTDGIVSK